MRPSHSQLEIYKTAIRAELIRDARIPVIQLQKRLDEQGLHFEIHYLCKLRDKVLAERIKYIDRRTENELKNEYFDVLRETMKKMFDILTDPFEYSHNRIAAAKEIRETYAQMLGGKADLAIIRGDIVINNNYNLPDAKRKAIVDTLEQFEYLEKYGDAHAAAALGTRDDRPAAADQGGH